MTKSTKAWIRGLVATVVNGFASGAVLIIADPVVFNLDTGLRKLVMTSAVFALLGLANYLKQHPVPDDGDSVPPRAWLLPLILAASIGTGCLPKAVVTPQPPVEDVQQVRAKAVQIAKAVESTGNLIVEARRATGAAYDARLITLEQRNAVYQAIIDLEPKAHVLIDIAATVTTTPELRATAQAFVGIVDDLLSKLGQGSGPMASTANAIRTALDVVFAFIGGDR